MSMMLRLLAATVLRVATILVPVIITIITSTIGIIATLIILLICTTITNTSTISIRKRNGTYKETSPNANAAPGAFGSGSPSPLMNTQ